MVMSSDVCGPSEQLALHTSKIFKDLQRSSEPLESLGFVGPFGLTGAGSWELLFKSVKCASAKTSTLAASGSTLQQLSIGIGRGAFTQVWSKVERFQDVSGDSSPMHLKLDVA